MIGESQTARVELFSAFIEKVTESKYRTSIASCSSHADEILRCCRTTKFDLVIILLNNIIFPEIGIGTRKRRSERWLRFIAEIKAVHPCAIIALCGYMADDPVLDTLHVTDAMAAGAKYFFTIPPAGPEMMGAIQTCVSEWARRAVP